jgi:hypothetical protein
VGLGLVRIVVSVALMHFWQVLYDHSAPNALLGLPMGMFCSGCSGMATKQVSRVPARTHSRVILLFHHAEK